MKFENKCTEKTTVQVRTQLKKYNFHCFLAHRKDGATRISGTDHSTIRNNAI
jgi:hypothetical protein